MKGRIFVVNHNLIENLNSNMEMKSKIELAYSFKNISINLKDGIINIEKRR